MPWQLPSSDPRVLRVHGAAQQLGEEQRAHGSRRAVEDHVVTSEAATCLVRVNIKGESEGRGLGVGLALGLGLELLPVRVVATASAVTE